MVTASLPLFENGGTGALVGVAGVDATLAEIENLLLNDRWGSVYAFLINEIGETIMHPLLKPSSEITDDPLFPDINDLEVNAAYCLLLTAAIDLLTAAAVAAACSVTALSHSMHTRASSLIISSSHHHHYSNHSRS
jgi:hypothetical protein